MISKAIVNAYVRRIKRGVITIDNVPGEIKDYVSSELNKETDGKIFTEQTAKAR